MTEKPKTLGEIADPPTPAHLIALRARINRWLDHNSGYGMPHIGREDMSALLALERREGAKRMQSAAVAIADARVKICNDAHAKYKSGELDSSNSDRDAAVERFCSLEASHIRDRISDLPLEPEACHEH